MNVSWLRDAGSAMIYEVFEEDADGTTPRGALVCRTRLTANGPLSLMLLPEWLRLLREVGRCDDLSYRWEPQAVGNAGRVQRRKRKRTRAGKELEETPKKQKVKMEEDEERESKGEEGEAVGMRCLQRRHRNEDGKGGRKKIARLYEKEDVVVARPDPESRSAFWLCRMRQHVYRRERW